MPKPSEYDKTHLRNMAAIGTRIDRIFKKAAEEAAKIGVSIKQPLPDDRIFSFDDYPATRKQIERLMSALQESMETTIVSGVRSAWTLSNNKNNALVSRIFGDRAGDLSKEQYRRYFSTNSAALDAFIGRKEQGLNLSDRVWRYTNAFKHEIELGLDLGIRTGESTSKMARSLRQYLQHPDKLFRRVRDEHGNLRLSKAAQAFHPGRGVYRSSYKNARRLAATETNIAYRTSDHLRWQQMDFVVGIEICLSNNHTLNGVPLTDICDTLAGRYPKDFKFTGWHPHCRCHVETILKTEEEMEQDTQRILAGEMPEKGSENTVRDVPAAFKDWVEEHASRIETGGNLPYFVKDNMAMVRPILALDKPIKIGDKEWTLRELIAESEVESTKNGKIYKHPGHGKSELKENLEFAKWRAEQFGEEVILLPNPHGGKSADSYNLTRGVQEEYKRGKTSTVNALDRLLRDGAKQADYVILEIDCDATPAVVANAMNDRLKRTGIKEVRVKIGNAEAVYTREEIIRAGFKIKPEDFLNESAFRSRGSSLEKGAEPNIVTNADAKLAKFFGLNKKTPQEIAIERHAKRDAAKIQQAWNERRIAGISNAVKDGLLPKECLTGLSTLTQEELNARIAFLQKRAARHAVRTPQEITDIKQRWAEKQLRDKHTRLVADNVLKLRSEYPIDVDFSVLEKIIADNNLTKMRDEARNVAQAIKAIRDEEKALADLIPDAHEWHKQFGITELREAHVKIQSTLDYWEAKGYDLATDSNLDILKKELEQKIKFVENPGAFKAGLTAHKTWQVQKQAYEDLLGKVETRIETIKLEADYQALLGFKTTSKDFKNFMAKAKAALDAGDPATAKHFINAADWKKQTLEAKRKGKSGTTGSISFPEMDKAEVQKLLDKFEKDTVRGVDKPLRQWMESEWANLTDEEQLLLTKYTQAYTYLNDRLRGLPPSSWRPQSEYDHDMPIITHALNKLKAPRNMVVRRGTGDYPISELGKYLSDLEEGDIFTEPAFLSTAAHRDKGFFKSYEMIIVVPKGARGAYAEPFSHYNDHGCAYDFDIDKIWDGSEVQKIGDEFEWIGQRGCQFKVLKKIGGKIIMQLIGQLK